MGKKHIIFIDPLDKLVIEKDSSLLIAHELKRLSEDAYIFFRDDLCLNSSNNLFELECYKFISETTNDFYLKKFELTEIKKISLGPDIIFHMRLEPPFNLNYLRSLWILDFLKLRTGMKVLNDPSGIALNNEKISSFVSSQHIKTYIGSSLKSFKQFVADIKESGFQSVILKPIDLFQGIGVKKVSLALKDKEIDNEFSDCVIKNQGQIMAQPFLEEVEKGEVRAVFFKGELIGAIKKIPKKGSFLANIAQGASFEKVLLNEIQTKSCREICKFLGSEVPWVAFDLIGDLVSEVNITCPGLLVEVSKAENKNLAAIIASEL